MPRQFAPYDPAAGRRGRLHVNVRTMTAADIPACAALAASRGHRTVARQIEVFERDLADGLGLMLVARHDARVVGYGKARWLHPGGDGGHGAPDGWYLTGLVVDPGARRCGVERQLTMERIRRLCGVTDTIWYFAAAPNQPSIDLHQQLGFRFVTAEFDIPGVRFSGGPGALFARRRSGDRSCERHAST